MKQTQRNYRQCGLTLIELLVALPVIAMLMTATMVALDASFKAYASAAEQATTQSQTRMVTQRLLTLIRTSTAHGPLLPDGASTPPVTIHGDLLTSPYLELVDRDGQLIRVEYEEATQTLWYYQTPLAGGTTVKQPLLTGVVHCEFKAKRRRNNSGVYVLERATMQLSVQPDPDATLAIESGGTPPVVVVASTMPRRLE